MTTYAYRRDFPTEDLPDDDDAAVRHIGAVLNRLTGLPDNRYNRITSLTHGDNTYETVWYLADRHADHREAISRLTEAGLTAAWTETDKPVCAAESCTVPSLWQRIFIPPNGPLADPRRINADTDAQEDLLDVLRDKGIPIPYQIHRCRITDQDPLTGELTLTWATQ